jgi:hypothetical protein
MASLKDTGNTWVSAGTRALGSGSKYPDTAGDHRRTSILEMQDSEMGNQLSNTTKAVYSNEYM